jgi:hypothetical protein
VVRLADPTRFGNGYVKYNIAKIPAHFPEKRKVEAAINALESNSATADQVDQFNISYLSSSVEDLVDENDMRRCVILIDDAAHSFSERQQVDFFDLFRAIKSKVLSPKAAIYPGITSHSASFHVGHDAEQIDAWVKPSGDQYEDFMLALARKRFEGTGVDIVSGNEEEIKFLAYAAFGIPRGFLSMLRAIFNSQTSYHGANGKLNKTKIL